MTHIPHILYKSEEKPDGFVGSIIQTTIFCIFEAKGAYTKEEGKIVQEHLVTIFAEERDPQSIDSKLRQLIREGTLPAGITVALGIVNDTTIYLKTFGNGQVWLRRGSDFIRLIQGNHSATGPINPGDTIIFTSDTFMQSVDSKLLPPFIDNSSLHAGIHELSEFLKDKVTDEVLALFIRIPHIPHSQPVTYPEVINHDVTTPVATLSANETIATSASEAITHPKKKVFHFPQISKIKGMLHTDKKNKIITFALVFIIILILVWSVGFGYKRRQTAQAMEKIKSTRDLVTQKLNQSDEVAFLNPQRSLILIGEARSEVELLKKSLSDEYTTQINEIDSMIKTREDEITHKENKSGEEFYDLTLDTKNATGVKFSLDKDMLSILDTSNSTLYNVSLSKKSLDKNTVKEAKTASIIVRYEDLSFIFGKSLGVYKVDSLGKATKIISPDVEWGNITDIQVYNGNLYVLDSAKNQIYKYVPTESGYSDKSSYIKSETSVQGASSLAIDSSIYVAINNQITKFTAGSEDEFKTVFPEDGVKIQKVITNADLEKVYAWDKDAGTMYILAKNGTYERQVKSSTFAQADDIIIFEKSAYALQKAKIFKVSLE